MSHITEDISTGIAAIKPITTGTQSNQMLSLFNVLAILFASVARAGYNKQVRRILTFKVCTGGKNDSMAEIFLHNKPIKSVFHLLGEHENDITYSVAWALAQSPAFLNRFIELATGKSIDTPNVVIRLQQHEQQGGITDIEIESPGRLH